MYSLKHLHSIDAEKLKDLVFAGEILCIKPCAEIKAFVRYAYNHLRKTFVPYSPRKAEFSLSDASHFQLSQKLKEDFSNSKDSWFYIQNILSVLNFQLGDLFFDIPRLRILSTKAHYIPEAEPAFYLHRDSWYANPKAQLNFWIPLHDMKYETSSFSFFPEYFQKSIQNQSSEFQYSSWKKSGGFQAISQEGRIYPGFLEAPEGSFELKISCSKGSILVFSSSHLHGTRPNHSLKTRLSLDFRVVSKSDFESKKGAPDPDNESKGTALLDYRNAVSFQKFFLV